MRRGLFTVHAWTLCKRSPRGKTFFADLPASTVVLHNIWSLHTYFAISGWIHKRWILAVAWRRAATLSQALILPFRGLEFNTFSASGTQQNTDIKVLQASKATGRALEGNYGYQPENMQQGTRHEEQTDDTYAGLCDSTGTNLPRPQAMVDTTRVQTVHRTVAYSFETSNKLGPTLTRPRTSYTFDTTQFPNCTCFRQLYIAWRTKYRPRLSEMTSNGYWRWITQTFGVIYIQTSRVFSRGVLWQGQGCFFQGYRRLQL